MMLALSSWTLRLLAVLTGITAAANAIMLGVFTFGLVSLGLYSIVLIGMFFGLFGKSLAKRPGWYLVFAVVLVTGLAGVTLYSSVAKKATGELLTLAKIDETSLFYRHAYSSFNAVYEGGKCKTFECEKTLTMAFFRYLAKETPKPLEKCISTHGAIKDRNLLSGQKLLDLGFNQELASMKPAQGQEKQYVFCNLEKPVYKLLESLWSFNYWLGISVGALILLQSLTPLLRTLRKRR